jgi:hypothetical protein
MMWRIADTFNFLGEQIDPDEGFNAVFDIIEALIGFSMFMIGALSVIGVVVGGIMMVTSGGSPDKIAKGKKTVGMAVAGLLLSMAALVIVRFVEGIF